MVSGCWLTDLLCFVFLWLCLTCPPDPAPLMRLFFFIFLRVYESLNPVDLFESLEAHSVAIKVFELAALPSSLSGDDSLHGSDDVVK